MEHFEPCWPGTTKVVGAGEASGLEASPTFKAFRNPRDSQPLERQSPRGIVKERRETCAEASGTDGTFPSRGERELWKRSERTVSTPMLTRERACAVGERVHRRRCAVLVTERTGAHRCALSNT